MSILILLITRLFRRIFSRGPQPQQQQTDLPPLGEPPPVGRSAPTSSNLPRGGPVVTSTEPVARWEIQPTPTEPVPREFRPTFRTDRGVQVGPAVDQGVQVGPPMLDQGVQVGPAMLDQGVQVGPAVDQGVQVGPPMLDRGTNPMRRVTPPRSIPLGLGTGGGAVPPRRRPPKLGGDGNSFEGFDPSEWAFLLVGLATSLAAYNYFVKKIQAKTEKALDALEYQKTKSADADGRLAFWRNKGWVQQGLGQSWVFLGSVLAGRRFFRRAVRLILVPPLRRAVRAVVPPVIQNLAGPVVDAAARVGLGALTPIARFLSFFFGLELLTRLFYLFAQPELVALVEPVMGQASTLIQGFFSTPKGVSVASGFLERTIKVVGGSLLFGNCYTQFLLIFEKNNGRRRALFFCCVCGFCIFLVFSDHRFVCVFVQGLVQKFPPIQQVLERPYGQMCLLFASGVLIQSAFPPVVVFFFAWAVYYSGLHYYFFKITIPFWLRGLK